MMRRVKRALLARRRSPRSRVPGRAWAANGEPQHAFTKADQATARARLAQALRLRRRLDGDALERTPAPTRAARTTTRTSPTWSRPASTTRRTSRAPPTTRSSRSRPASSRRRRWRSAATRGWPSVSCLRASASCSPGESQSRARRRSSPHGPIAFPKAGDRSNAYRLVASVKTPTVTLPVTADIVLFNKGRTDVAMIFLGIARPLPASLEQTAVARVLSRVTR